MNYYIMSSQYATFTGASYDNNKWTLSGDRPEFDGFTIDLSSKTQGDLDELLGIIERMLITPPQGFMLVIPRWFGLYLYENHEVFKPDKAEESI